MREFYSVSRRLAREPRTRVALAGIAGAAPLLLGGLLWVSKLSFLYQLLVGLGMGVATVASIHFWALHRRDKRRGLAVKVAQMAQLDVAGLRILIPGQYFPNWVLQPNDFEKVNWINKQIEKAWPVLEKAASDILKLQLQQVLDQYRMGPVKRIFVKSLSLGGVGPTLGGVKFTAGGEDESTIDVIADWRHGREQKMLLKLETTGPDLSVQIKNFTIYGILKVIFKPLVGKFPGFGALTASLQEPPLIEFEIKFLGGDVLSIPGLEQMIDNIIKTALMDMLVWPSRMVFPILPGDYSFLELRPVGQLEVFLVEADKLLNKETFGKSDPVVSLFIRQKADAIKRSSTKKNSLSPVWNERFFLQVEDPESQCLNVRVMDSDPLGASDFLGCAEIPIKQFEPNIPKDMWISLAANPKKVDDKFRGCIHLVITYKPFSLEQMGLNQSNVAPNVIGEESQETKSSGIKQISAYDAIDKVHNQHKTETHSPTASPMVDKVHEGDVDHIERVSADPENIVQT